MGAVGSGAAFVADVTTGIGSVEFPNAGTPLWIVQKLRRDRWRRGRLRITTTYTATVGSTANFRLTIRLRETQGGDVYPTTALLDVSRVIPGPAVAYTEMKDVYVSPGIVMPGTKPNLNIILLRATANAADVNANSLHVVSQLWEILPA
jgi:hypothetical protein